jgi:ABC-type uncharacterized transport system auxiliary subunit
VKSAPWFLASVARAVLALALASGCALTSRAEPAKWEWFTPEQTRQELTSAAIGNKPAVHIRRVTSGLNLGSRIAFGDGGFETGYYDRRRWTEQPTLYVRRALERTICQEQRFRCDVDAEGPALDVEVLKFQELKKPDSHAGVVVLRIVLSNVDQVLVDDTIQVVEPVAGERFVDVVAAIARALDGVSERTARRVSSATAQSPH